jgi:enoyl-CoA hydratase
VSMEAGRVTLVVEGPVATVTFDRPAARNAMTFEMYRQLAEACREIDGTEGLRAAIFRGAGPAFVAGTDIAEFTAFSGGEDGLAYEEKVEAVIAGLERLRVPSVAVVDGPAVGGGMVLASVCDFRVVTPQARFGVPIARTLGNCLSVRNVARLAGAVGPAIARKMLLLSALIDGAEAERIGLALACVERERLKEKVADVVATLVAAAPLTVAASREAFLRIGRGEAADADLVAQVYGSRDFSEGVRAFLEKRRPDWQGH